VPFGIGNDDRLEDGADDGVAQLKLHLAASGFGVVKISQSHGQAVEFRGKHAEVVAAIPVGAVIQVALGNFVCVRGQPVNGAKHQIYSHD